MNFACVGLRGTRKTTLARHMADKAKLRVIFDPTPNRGNFPRRAHQSFATTAAGARAAIATLGAFEPDDQGGAMISEVLIAPAFDVDDCFDATCEALTQWLDAYRDTIDEPGVVFLVDECWSVSDRVMPEFFSYLARCGDLNKLQLIVTAHAPVDVSPRLRKIVQWWFLFQTVDVDDLELIRKRCGDDVAEQLPTLPIGHFVMFDEGKRKWEIRRGFQRPVD